MKKLIFPLIVCVSMMALSVGAYPPPEKDEMRLDKFISQQALLDGKVVEVEFAHVESVKAVSSGNYTARCIVWTHSGSLHSSSGITVEFSGEDAKDYFDDLAEQMDDPFSDGAGESIFVLVDGRKLIALGEKYKKSKGTYSW